MTSAIFTYSYLIKGVFFNEIYVKSCIWFAKCIRHCPLFRDGLIYFLKNIGVTILSLYADSKLINILFKGVLRSCEIDLTNIYLILSRCSTWMILFWYDLLWKTNKKQSFPNRCSIDRVTSKSISSSLMIISFIWIISFKNFYLCYD